MYSRRYGNDDKDCCKKKCKEKCLNKGITDLCTLCPIETDPIFETLTAISLNTNTLFALELNTTTFNAEDAEDALIEELTVSNLTIDNVFRAKSYMVHSTFVGTATYTPVGPGSIALNTGLLTPIGQFGAPVFVNGVFTSTSTGIMSINISKQISQASRIIITKGPIPFLTFSKGVTATARDDSLRVKLIVKAGDTITLLANSTIAGVQTFNIYISVY